MNELGKALDIYLHKYDHILLIGDSNSDINERPMHDFCNAFNLESLSNTPTCFKSSENPSCIYLSKSNFDKALVLESGLSDFHELVVSVLKTCFKKKIQVWLLPYVWMFHNRRYSNKINCLHERMLRIVYKDCKSSFAERLSEDKSFTVHHRNVQKLAIEMYMPETYARLI